MTSEQTWAFYRLIPALVAEGLIEPGLVPDWEVGQRILDLAAEDGVTINADDFELASDAAIVAPNDARGRS